MTAGASVPASLRVSHVCHSLTQKARDALDAIDGQKRRRLAAIDKLYRTLTKESMEEALADDFVMSEMGHARRFTKGDYVGMMTNVTLPAVPDFSWSAASTGDVADDGYCLVVVRASGHHTGGDLCLPGLEPLPPSGKRFCLAEEVHKLKVDITGRVTEIVVLPNKGAGPRAMYQALGGTLPAPPAPAAAADGTPPMP